MAIIDNLGGGSSGAVLDTLEEIAANTESGKAAGALAVKELNDSLGEVNNRFNNLQTIKTKTITATTDGNGIIYLDNYTDIKTLVSVTTNDNYSTILTKLSGKNAFFVFAFASNGTMVIKYNTSITANICYL